MSFAYQLTFYLSLFLSQAMVAINIVGSKYLLQFISPLYILLARFAIAAVFLSLFYFGRKCFRVKPRVQRARLRDLTRKDWFYIAAQALSAGILFNLLMYWGLHYSSANVAGIITSTLPALIAIFSMIFLSERMTLPTLLCIVFAVLGLVVINARNIIGSHTGSLVGDLLILLSMLPEAMYYVLSKMHPNRLPLFLVATIMNLFNFTVISIILLIIQAPVPTHLPAAGLVVLTFVGIATGLFFVFWYFGCQHVSGGTAGLFTAAMPVSTMMLAWIFLGEGVTWYQGAGMVLILCSIGFNVLRIKVKTNGVESGQK